MCYGVGSVGAKVDKGEEVSLQTKDGKGQRAGLGLNVTGRSWYESQGTGWDSSHHQYS